jgi:hypothetical protein
MGNLPELWYCLTDPQCDNCSDNTVTKHHCHIYMCVPFVLQCNKILHVCINTKSLMCVILLLCVCLCVCVRMCLFCLTLKEGNLWPADNCQIFKGCPSPFIIEGRLLFSSLISVTAAIEIHMKLNIFHNLFKDMRLLGMILLVWQYCIWASFVSYREWKWRNMKNWRHQLSPHRFQYQLQLKTKSIL